jgi:hypothetical protein
LSESVTAFKAARLFLPQKMVELKPDAAAADSCTLGHMYEGLGIAKTTDATLVELPLQSYTLKPLLLQLRSILQHNFFLRAY